MKAIKIAKDDIDEKAWEKLEKELQKEKSKEKKDKDQKHLRIVE